MPENINLFTHLRLDDFVKNFQTWINSPDNPINPESSYKGSEYEYVSFIPSSDAIRLIDIGRIPLDEIKSFFQPTQSQNSNGNTVAVNTPSGWKTQLGKEYSDIKKTENKNIKTSTSYTVSDGLFGQAITLQISDNGPNVSTPSVASPAQSGNSMLTFNDLGISQQNFLKYIDIKGSSWINAFSQPYETQISNVYSGIFSNINYDNDFSFNSTPGSSGPGVDIENVKNLLETSFIGIEYFGYFKPEIMGNYSFTIDAGQDFCLMWLGNKAVCEYVKSNVDIKSSNMEFKQTVLDDSYIPIRIQYFASKQRIDGSKVNQNKRTFSIKVKNNDTNTILINSQCFKTIKNNNKIYIPTFIYCAFVSERIDDFKQGKFVCYSFSDKTDDDNNKFFSYMKANKNDIFDGKYDSVTTDGLSISEYGTLPNGINYTDAYNPSTTIPSTLSVYRIYSDIRMGRTFQVNKTKKNGKYEMSELSGNLISFTDKYTEFPNYYPSADPVNRLDKVSKKNKNECSKECNEVSDSKCSYFYTYTKDNTDYCMTGTNYSSLLFNQIPGNNQSNGSLYIRGYETAKPTIEECRDGIKTDKKSLVTNTIDYTASNPYYNYTITNNVIENPGNLAACGDEKLESSILEYKKRQQEAARILYDDEQYRSDGYYMKMPGTFSKPNYGEMSADFIKKVPGYKAPGVETFETQMTDATQDTGSNINKLRSIQQSVQQKENAIHENKKKISGDLIPTFTKTRDVLKDDNKYDYNGDVLMYLRDTKIPSKDEQRLIDSSDERFKQGSMYSLGIITAATLIIFAIYLGKD
jgi:hypothetical protein